MNKTKHNDINRLRSLTLTLTSISIPLKGLQKIQQMPIYRVQIELDNLIIDETSDIIATVAKKDKSLNLVLGSAEFKYTTSDLFSTHKVARLIVKVLRSSIFSTYEQVVDQYQIVLSQYSYQYSSQKKTIMNQHSVGLYKRSFLNYSVHCSYKKMVNKENQTLSKIPILKRNTNHNEQSRSSTNQYEPLFRRDNGVLPIDSIEREKEDIVFIQDGENTPTYISMNKLKPVYLTDKNPETKIKIHLDHSFMNVEQTIFQQQLSVIEEKKKISEGMGVVKNLMFSLYMILSLARIAFLMVPTPKV